MSIAKNTKETFLEEIIDNLSGNTRELPVDCKPRTREEVLLSEIEKNTRTRSTSGTGSSSINDENISNLTTWSSEKIVDYVSETSENAKGDLQEQIDEVNSQLEHNVKNLSKNYYTKAQSRANTNDIPINVSEFDTETKKLLTGGSVAVVGENSVGKENLKLKSVGVYNTDFAEIGKNLFDKSKISEKGWYMQYTNGEPVSNKYVTELCYSDYMPVVANEKYITNEYIHSYCIFDVNKSFISGGTAIKKECIITIPSDGAYLVINPNYSEVDKVQTEHGEIITSYEPYSYNFKNAKVNYEVEKVKSELESTINGFNIINNKFDNISSYKDISIDTGTYTTPRDAISTFTGWAIPFSKSDLLEDITYISLYATAYDNATDKNILSNVSVNLELLDENRNVLKVLGKGNLVESGKIEFKLQIPLDDLPSIFFLGLRATQKCVLMLWNGEQNPNYTFGDKLMFYSTSYEDSINIYSQSNTNSYGITDIKIGTGAGLNIPEHRHKASDIEGIEDILLDNKVKLSLPDKYELVVGDTFELFYKGILLCNNPYNYNIDISCSKGAYYSKKYMFTPTASDIGTHNMTISVYNDNEQLLDSKTVNLVVKNKASNPATVKNVLCVGDSLTSGGVWPSEACRRLTGTGGTPVGEGLSNINFIGSKKGSNGAYYEGYGGWTYGNYNGNSVSLQNYWINTTANKNNSYQKSVWKDANNVEWVLETLETGRIKVYRKNTGTQMLPATGTLTWVSGGDGSDNSNITYTSYVAESGNPFWNDSTSSVDFKNYATKLGVSSIDHCYVLLGWNQTGNSEASFKDGIRTFVNNLRSSFPNCKITLLGLQVPSLDGFGSNYGCNWNFYDKLKVVFNMNQWNYDVVQEYSNMDFINIAGQFDTENNMPNSTRQVNTRNTKTETYGSNGVHPANEGYLQIADAVYRHLSHNINS